MTTNLPPLGYSLINPPASLKDAYMEYRMVDKAVTIVKSAIQQYIDSFLNPNGSNRKFFTSSLSPIGLQFVTELTYDDQMKTNPNLRKTYLARFFAENVGRLPSILIIDTGVELIDSGINELVGARVYDGFWEGFLCVIMKVSLSITVATLSEEDTSTLATMIATMVNPLATVINNCILRDPKSPWEVRLPLSGLTMGQGSNVNIEGDTKTSVWTRAVDMTCEFETQIGLKQPIYKLGSYKPVIGSNGVPLPRFFNLIPNQEIKLGEPYPLMVDGMLDSYYLGVSDPSIALVTSEPPYILQPRAQGKALLLVSDRSVVVKVPERTKQAGYIMDVPFIVVR